MSAECPAGDRANSPTATEYPPRIDEVLLAFFGCVPGDARAVDRADRDATDLVLILFSQNLRLPARHRGRNLKVIIENDAKVTLLSVDRLDDQKVVRDVAVLRK